MAGGLWAVIWRPDLTHVARALGPYRSERKADAVVEEMLVLEDELQLVVGFDQDELSWLPQAVRLESWPDVKRALIEEYADPDEEGA